jgi:hypothetical protein
MKETVVVITACLIGLLTFWGIAKKLGDVCTL